MNVCSYRYIQAAMLLREELASPAWGWLVYVELFIDDPLSLLISPAHLDTAYECCWRQSCMSVAPVRGGAF